MASPTSSHDLQRSYSEGHPPNPPHSLSSPPTNLHHLPARSSPLAPPSRRLSSQSINQSGSQLSHTSNESLALVPREAPGSLIPSSPKPRAHPLGRARQLRADVDGVVKRRAGGVLGRGFVLKTDHYPNGRALDLDLNVQGAPNFRAPDEESLNVFGVAQPTVPGLKSISTVLSCQPKTVELETDGRRRSSFAVTPEVEGQSTLWISTREETSVYIAGRPYVLRDASRPFQTLALSDRADNLEDIERRLKLDILEESKRYGGLILCHDEVGPDTLVPTWVSVDESVIRTPKEVFNDVQKAGWRVDYSRIPVGPDRPIEDNYLDAYVSRLKDVDPLTTSLVFNCGMGVVRTTFAMVAALLSRRAQYIRRGSEDPFGSLVAASGISTPLPSSTANAVNPEMQATSLLQQATQQQALNRSLLKVTRMLDENLPSRRSAAAIDLSSSHPNSSESSRRAHMGNYNIVSSSSSALDHGRETKRLVDVIIDNCDAVVNSRESVIEYRIKYSVASRESENSQSYLDKAMRALEQYFDSIVFAAFVDSKDGMASGAKFSEWSRARPEIWNQIKISRRRWGDRSFAFAPANDLSVISRSLDLGDRRERRYDPTLEIEGKVLGDEWAEHVVKNRSGIMSRASTSLKRDSWIANTAPSSDGIRGAIGFRQVQGTSIYATGQPTEDAITNISHIIKERQPDISSVVWICLREEPLVMINGAPYCSRRDAAALRNMRDYTGVGSSRLELLEERLKSDVVAESAAFGGSVLVHTEDSAGRVVPLWEKVEKLDVETSRQVMDSVSEHTSDVKFTFERVPITSESSPDFHDITESSDVMMRIDIEKTAVISNDQLGRGRSSNCAAIVFSIQRWSKKNRQQPTTPRRTQSRSRMSQPPSRAPASRTSWQIINSCSRVIRNGLDVKAIVDEAIDRTSSSFNLRDAIEDARDAAQRAKTTEQRHQAVDSGMHHLLRYFHSIVFQAYSDDTVPDDETAYTFESFVKHRPVFKTLETESSHGGINSLTPIERTEPLQGLALEDEVHSIVANRAGAILSAQTILKSDFFLGLQKQSSPERVDGAANYRRVPLSLEDGQPQQGEEHYVYGTGMPSSEGSRNALTKMGCAPDGPRRVLWTSLREEPVLYIMGRPHVSRSVDRPSTNVETTGVTAAVVERMEATSKEDVSREIRQSGGRMLLHDEVETKPGVYEVVPIWEQVGEDDVMTPSESYARVEKEDYHVDYMRIAITDEQAPLPAASQQIVQRVSLGLGQGDDFVFNCQMGRGRTTTGMIAASSIATIAEEDMSDPASFEEDMDGETDTDMPEEAQYSNGEYKTILQLVTVSSHGKRAKRSTDRVINAMEGVQNSRRAVYDFKLKVAAADPGSAKHAQLSHQGINYLYRYGALIVLANFSLESKEKGVASKDADFPSWLEARREIRNVSSRKTLD